ncbi:MAG: ISKra4 family transposase [bacterium]
MPAPTTASLHTDLDRLIEAAHLEQSLSAMVLIVLSGLRVLGQHLVTLVLEQRSLAQHQERGETPRCPHCGRRMRKPQRKETSRMTLLGKLRYRRHRWLCPRCKRTHAPLDSTLGLHPLHEGHSGEFVTELALLCTLHAFEQGCSLFERSFGFPVSTHLAYRVVMGIGRSLADREMARAEACWKARSECPEDFEPTPAELRKRTRAKRIYVMMDNSKARIQEGKRGRGAKKRTKQKGAQERFNIAVKGPSLVKDVDDDKASRGESDWRDVRALLIYQEKDVAQCSKNRRQILKRRVLAHVGTQDQWLQLLHLAFHEEGVYVAEEVVVVADGGAGIWEAISELLPSTSQRKVVQILDWCHAVSHLWAVAKKWKKGTKKAAVTARAKWVDGLVKYLADGKVSNVLQRLQNLRRGKTGELAEELDRCIKYFEEHRKRMHYRQYRDAGMTIGSGAIESVHKWVVQARCHLAGMAWSEVGLNAMLRLRCLWASGGWDDEFRRTDTAAAELPWNPVRAAAAGAP